MINLNNLTGSTLSIAKLDRLMQDTKKLGKLYHCSCLDELNMYLKESNQSVDEAYHRFTEKRTNIYDSLKNKVMARSGNVIIIYARIASIETRLKLEYKPMYKCEFPDAESAMLWMIKNYVHRGRFYKHSKSGKLYEYLGESTNSENPEETLVIYKALYGEGMVWSRPKSMFFEEVEIDGKLVPRFVKINANEIEYEETEVADPMPNSTDVM